MTLQYTTGVGCRWESSGGSTQAANTCRRKTGERPVCPDVFGLMSLVKVTCKDAFQKVKDTEHKVESDTNPDSEPTVFSGRTWFGTGPPQPNQAAK